MDAKTCIQKLEYVGVLAFATVDEKGGPQIRNISAIPYEHDPEAMYFFISQRKRFLPPAPFRRPCPGDRIY